MSPSLVIFLGLANWLGTTIIVESELFRPLREWVNNRRIKAEGYTMISERYGVITCPWRCRAWGKATYLVSCHLCAGTWVGLAIAAVAGSPVPGVLGFVLGGLVFKAIGHITLEVTAALKAVSR